MKYLKIIHQAPQHASSLVGQLLLLHIFYFPSSLTLSSLSESCFYFLCEGFWSVLLSYNGNRCFSYRFGVSEVQIWKASHRGLIAARDLALNRLEKLTHVVEDAKNEPGKQTSLLQDTHYFYQPVEPTLAVEDNFNELQRLSCWSSISALLWEEDCGWVSLVHLYLPDNQ